MAPISAEQFLTAEVVCKCNSSFKLRTWRAARASFTPRTAWGPAAWHRGHRLPATDLGCGECEPLCRTSPSALQKASQLRGWTWRPAQILRWLSVQMSKYREGWDLIIALQEGGNAGTRALSLLRGRRAAEAEMAAHGLHQHNRQEVLATTGSGTHGSTPLPRLTGADNFRVAHSYSLEDSTQHGPR